MFKVGDTIRDCISRHSFTVLAVGDNAYFVRAYNGRETVIAKKDNYEVVPKEHVRYVNLYPDDFTTRTYNTRAIADREAGIDRIACKRIVITEGKFDD